MPSPRSILDILKRRADADAERRAFLELPDGDGTGHEWTYRELLEASSSVAASLRGRVAPGERVLLLVPGGLGFLRAFFGCMLAGCIPVPLPPPQHRRQIDRIGRVRRDCLAESAIVEDPEALLLGQDADEPAAGLGLRCFTLSELDVGAVADAPELDPGDAALLQYTSGSTGNPKGALVTHAGILANQAAIERCFAHDESCVVVGWLPLFHDMGLIGNILQSLYCGIPCVLLPTVRVLQNPVLWLRAISRFRGTTSGGPDFMYSLSARKVRPEDKRDLDLSCWRVAFNGSEPVRVETLSAFAEAFAGCGFRGTAFLPCYGLAEATLLVTGRAMGRGARVVWADRQRLERGVVRESAAGLPGSAPYVSCGQTWSDTRIRIVDPESGDLLPDGRVGEVTVQGGSVVPGYWGASADRSVISTDVGHGIRTLRTGDLGFLSGGELFVVGRLKDTVVVRGRNLYAADIEAVAQSAHPRLHGRRAAAFAAGTDEGATFVLVHEAARGEAGDGEAICREVRARMAGEVGVTPDAILLTRPGMIPVTTSGKVQRRGCRDRLAAGELPVWYEWRKTIDEEMLAETLAAALTDPAAALPRLRATLSSAVDLRTPVAALGLDSVQMLRLGHEIEARTGVRLSWPSLTGGTLQDLLDATGTGADARARTREDSAGEDAASAPLSPGQLALWYLHLLAPDSPHWHLARSLQFEGGVNRHALRQALGLAVARHPSLRMRVALEGGAWVQTYAPARACEWTVSVDASGMTDAALRRAVRAAATRSLAPESGRLFRALWFDRPHAPILQLAVHHLAADLWSVGIVLRDLLGAYARFAHGRPAHLPPLRGRYSAYARRQVDLAAAAEPSASQTHWQAMLEGESPGVWPGHRADVESAGDLRTISYTSVIPPGLAARVRETARHEGRTPFEVLAAAFHVLLGQFIPEPRSVIGTVVSGRADAESSDVVGYFAKVVPMRVDLSDDPSFHLLLPRIGGAVRAAVAHQDYPIELLYGRASATRRPQPPFDTVFVFQGASAGTPGLTAPLAVGAASDVQHVAGLRVRALQGNHAVPQFPLVVSVAETNHEYLVHVSSRIAGPWSEAAQALGTHFRAVIEAALDHPALRVSQLDCRPIAQRDPAGPGAVSWPSGLTLHGEFSRVAAEGPDRVAVAADEQITYACLERESDRLAACLPADEQVIGLYIGRTAAVSVAVLGILKAGAAYLPVATTWPAAHVRHVLETAGVTVVVTTREDETALPGGIRRVYVDSPSGGLPVPRRAARDDDRALAYLIYTSGSTGDPKAVSVSHGHVLRLLAGARRLFDFTADDVWTLFHAISFDFSVWELWGALAHGARVEIPDRAVARDPAAFHQFLLSRQVTVLNQTPTAFAWLQRYLVDGGSGAIRYVVFGGERLDFHMLAPSFAVDETRPTFVNMYGITETTVHVTFHAVSREEVVDGRISYIGHPLPDLQTHVLNASMRPVPAGAVGEIYVGGAGVANGYWRRPEATAERFVPDPFTAVPGSRLYRTGDMARLLSGGSLAYIGRRDKQVKVRGHRIELGAIESAILRHPDVSQVAVLFQRPRERSRLLQLEMGRSPARNAQSAPPARELLARVEEEAAESGRICAFVVRAAERSVDVPTLRAFAAELLPDYMRPSRWVLVDALPRTVNGKVDAQALAALVSDRTASDREFVAPRTALEAKLAEIWARALGVAAVGIDDNLFELGCDSIRSLRIVGRARECGIGFTLAQLLEAQTVRALAAVAADHTAAEPRPVASAAAEPIARLPEGVEEAYPLARLQEGLLYHCALDPDPSLYRDVFLYHLRMPLDAEALEAALRQVTQRHAALRTAFDLDTHSEPMQLVYRFVRPSFHVVDGWSSEGDRAAALLRWAEIERRRPLNFDRPPPIRFFVLPDEGSFHLTLSFHDALLDGWSASLLLGEIIERYRHALAGSPLPVTPLPRVSFRDFVMAEREELRRSEAQEFWRTALEGCSPRLIGRRTGHRGSLQVGSVPITPEESAQLIALAAAVKAPLKSVLLALHLRVLACWFGTERVVTGLESNGRLEMAGADEALGLHLNTLPFAFHLGRGSWTDLVTAVFARERAIWPFRRYPLSEIKKRWTRGEIFDSVFNFTHFHHLRGLESLSDVSVLGARGLGSTHYALRAEFNRDPFRDLVQLDLELDTGRLSAAEREALVAAYADGIRTIIESGRTPAQHHFIPAWTGPERAFTGSPLPPEAPATFQEAFDRVVRRHPDAVALTFDQGSLTYAGLDDAASVIAAALRDVGIRRGERVGICLEDPVHGIAAMMAALKLACPYVPLDPNAPPARLGVVAAEARLACVIAAGGARLDPAAFADVPTILTVTPDWFAPAAAGARPAVGAPARPDDLVYVIFTSGSTGAPKGVMVTQRNLVASLEARILQYPEHPDAFLLLSPLVFDSSVAVVFGSLYRGGTIVVPPADVRREPVAIVEWIRCRQVTHLLALPWVYAALLDAAAPAPLDTLRRVIVAGEACQPAHVLRHFRELPAVELANEYGPTESTVWSTVFDCRRYGGQTTVPIGRPVAGLTVRLLAPGLQPVRPGGEGEIYLAGPAVAAGYLCRPELTAASFVPDPFSPEGGARLYRTGDRARVGDSGNLEFLGRIDRQIKIRGHRVEPSEIEAVLLSFPGVGDARVAFEPAARQLVSFVTPRPGVAIDPADIRRHAGRWLPEHMRPARFHVVPSLPRTATGKLDLASLALADGGPAVREALCDSQP